MAKTKPIEDVDETMDVMTDDWDSILAKHPSCNFWVRPIARTKQQRVFVPELNATTNATIPEPRATAITVTIPGKKRNARGEMIDDEFSDTIDLPFTTFDNSFIKRHRMTPEMVAQAIYSMPAFGHSVEFEPMTDKEVRTFNRDKKSPQVREAIRKAMDINPSAIIREQERLEVQSTTGGARAFSMPNFQPA